MIPGLILVVVAAGVVAVLDLRPEVTNVFTAIILSLAITAAVVGPRSSG